MIRCVILGLAPSRGILMVAQLLCRVNNEYVNTKEWICCCFFFCFLLFLCFFVSSDFYFF